MIELNATTDVSDQKWWDRLNMLTRQLGGAPGDHQLDVIERAASEIQLSRQRIAELEAERDQLSAKLSKANDSIAIFHLQRDNLATHVQDCEDELEAHATDRVTQRREVAEAKAQLELARKALIKLRDYNGAIAKNQINYRPEDHIQVAK